MGRSVAQAGATGVVTWLCYTFAVSSGSMAMLHSYSRGSKIVEGDSRLSEAFEISCSVILAVHHGSAWQKGETRLVGEVYKLCRVRKLINLLCSRLRAAWTWSRLVGNGQVEALAFQFGFGNWFGIQEVMIPCLQE